jgi:DNA-binding IclR family transcriptional regulator
MSKIVERTLDFIELFAREGRPLSLSEIARFLQVPASSCHDVLQALLARGYITEVAPRGGYYPTMRLHMMATDIARRDPLAQRAEKVLAALRDELEETVSLGKATGKLGGIHLMVFESANPLRFHNDPGQPIRSLHATSAGKVILGGLPPDQFEAWLETAELKQLTPHTLTSKPALRRSIDQGRSLGWYRNDEESALGVTTIGAPFRWLNVRYFVTVAGPTQRMIRDIDADAASLLRTCRQLENGEFV